jgi:hypothetical protein
METLRNSLSTSSSILVCQSSTHPVAAPVGEIVSSRGDEFEEKIRRIT